MDFNYTETQQSVIDGINQICKDFPDSYWLEKDDKAEFPHEFAKAVTDSGYLGIVMPEEYGGAGLGYTEASLMMQAIAESGAGIAGCSAIHVNIFLPGAIFKFGTEEQKQRWIEPLLTMKDRAAFGITEPGAGMNGS